MTAKDLYSEAAALTTHALDIAVGRPAAGLQVRLFRKVGGKHILVASETTNASGRCDKPLLTRARVELTSYVLEFDAGAYHGAVSPFGVIPVEFNIADLDGHYHVPLVFAPGGYSAYRGAPPSRAPKDGGNWGTITTSNTLPEHHSAPSSVGAGLSIHVIDTARGIGGGGLKGVLYRRGEKDAGDWQRLHAFTVNDEGRTDRWLVEDGHLVATDYEIIFDAGDYYRTAQFGVGDIPFLAAVRIRLRIEDPSSHHHVPLLLSPWGYSCYRGS
jgi:5-hydroxyisourate hydrolase